MSRNRTSPRLRPASRHGRLPQVPVPGAGGDARISEDATFTSLSFPAIDDARGVAFLGKWKSSVGVGAGIFVGDPPALVVALGEVAQETGGATFKAISDPLLAPSG